MTKHSIRVWRAIRGLTQKQIASRIGVHPVTFSDYETGKMMLSGATLQKLAAVFECSSDEIDLSSHRSEAA